MSALRQMILNRQATLDSLYGHSIRFEKGKPTLVPLICQAQALAMGAEFADGRGYEEPEKPAGSTAPIDPGERALAIAKAVNEVYDRNDNKEFTAAGIPRDAVLERILGFGISAKERNTAIQARAEALEAARQEAAGNA